MAGLTENKGARSGIPWRVIGWGTAAILLFVPLLANLPWTIFDFLFLGGLLLLIGATFELIASRSSLTYRLAAGAAVATAVLLVLINAMVGMIGSEENSYNLFFAGVVLIALVGSIAARFKPAGLGWAMTAAAIAQVVAGIGGLFTDTVGGILAISFAALWVAAALLFQKAAREQDLSTTNT